MVFFESESWHRMICRATIWMTCNVKLIKRESPIILIVCCFCENAIMWALPKCSSCGARQFQFCIVFRWSIFSFHWSAPPSLLSAGGDQQHGRLIGRHGHFSPASCLPRELVLPLGYTLGTLPTGEKLMNEVDWHSRISKKSWNLKINCNAMHCNAAIQQPALSISARRHLRHLCDFNKSQNWHRPPFVGCPPVSKSPYLLSWGRDIKWFDQTNKHLIYIY